MMYFRKKTNLRFSNAIHGRTWEVGSTTSLMPPSLCGPAKTIGWPNASQAYVGAKAPNKRIPTDSSVMLESTTCCPLNGAPAGHFLETDLTSADFWTPKNLCSKSGNFLETDLQIRKSATKIPDGRFLCTQTFFLRIASKPTRTFEIMCTMKKSP